MWRPVYGVFGEKNVTGDYVEMGQCLCTGSGAGEEPEANTSSPAGRRLSDSSLQSEESIKIQL